MANMRPTAANTFATQRMGLELFKRTMLSGDGRDPCGCLVSGYRGTFQLR
jgi:hypothetical protein